MDFIMNKDPNWETNLTEEQGTLMRHGMLVSLLKPNSPERETVARELAEMENEYFAKHGQGKCCICGEPLYNDTFKEAYFGNNAYPAASGRCCDECNHSFVLPARFALGKNAA